MRNSLSAASGIVVAIALIRGLARHGALTIGNLWVDLTRAKLYLLLPLALPGAVVLVSQGVIQNFSSYRRGAPGGVAEVKRQLNERPPRSRRRFAGARSVHRRGARSVLCNQSLKPCTVLRGLVRPKEVAQQQLRVNNRLP